MKLPVIIKGVYISNLLDAFKSETRLSGALVKTGHDTQNVRFHRTTVANVRTLIEKHDGSIDQLELTEVF